MGLVFSKTGLCSLEKHQYYKLKQNHFVTVFLQAQIVLAFQTEFHQQ